MGVSGNSDSFRGESLDAAFERFVAASAPGLLRSAYVLTGDHADADDLLAERTPTDVASLVLNRNLAGRLCVPCDGQPLSRPSAGATAAARTCAGA